jgi:hypothetical protein
LLLLFLLNDFSSNAIRTTITEVPREIGVSLTPVSVGMKKCLTDDVIVSCQSMLVSQTTNNRKKGVDRSDDRWNVENRTGKFDKFLVLEGVFLSLNEFPKFASVSELDQLGLELSLPKRRSENSSIIFQCLRLDLRDIGRTSQRKFVEVGSEPVDMRSRIVSVDAVANGLERQALCEGPERDVMVFTRDVLWEAKAKFESRRA